MRNALRIHVALSEFVVGAICLTLLVGSVAYFKVHQAPAPAPVKADCTSEPSVTISQIVYYVPVPVTVKVRVKVEQPKPESSSKDTQLPDAVPQPEQQPDPVFLHRTPIITSALRTPMNELDKK